MDTAVPWWQGHCPLPKKIWPALLFPSRGLGVLSSASLSLDCLQIGGGLNRCIGDMGITWGTVYHLWRGSLLHGGALKGDPTEYYPSRLGRSYLRLLTTSSLRQFTGFKVASPCNLRLITESLGAVFICEWVIGPASQDFREIRWVKLTSSSGAR